MIRDRIFGQIDVMYLFRFVVYLCTKTVASYVTPKNILSYTVKLFSISRRRSVVSYSYTYSAGEISFCCTSKTLHVVRIENLCSCSATEVIRVTLLCLCGEVCLEFYQYHLCWSWRVSVIIYPLNVLGHLSLPWGSDKRACIHSSRCNGGFQLRFNLHQRGKSGNSNYTFMGLKSIFGISSLSIWHNVKWLFGVWDVCIDCMML